MEYFDFIIDQKFKISYCRVPKAGLTSWREIFRILHNVSSPNIYGLRRNLWVHSYSATNITTSIHNFDFSFWRSEAYANATNVIFSRHPFERFLSAYLDKIGQPARQTSFRKIIMKCIRCKRPCKYRTGKEAIPFPLFVDAVLTKKCRDRHWEPIYDLCLPCQIRYDFLVRMETFSRDVKCVLKAINAWTIPEVGRYNAINATNYLNYYYSQLTPIQIRNLWKYFYFDHIMFNYSFLNFPITAATIEK